MNLQESRARLVDLARRNARLTRALERVLDRDQLNAREFATLLARRQSVADERLALLECWVIRLAHRLAGIESCATGLDQKLDEHETSLHLICDILKELDDPYGFGLSLDEQIAEEGSGWASDDLDD
jgi:hypothetical protein